MSTDILAKIYNSYTTIMEIMKSNGYDTSAHENITQGELERMLREEDKEKNLEIILEDTKNNKKVFIKYCFKALNAQIINNTVMQIFDTLDILNRKTDTLFFIVPEPPSAAINDVISKLWESEGTFIVVEHLKQLNSNILKHELVPKHHIMTDEEIDNDIRFAPFKSDIDYFPQISRFDPVARLICARPGQIVHISRSSETAIIADYWRVVVNKYEG